MELDRAAIRDEEEAASEVTEGPVPQAPLHDRAAVAVVPPEARPLGRPEVVVAVVVLTGVRAEEAAVAHHRVVAVSAVAAADINRSIPQVL